MAAPTGRFYGNLEATRGVAALMVALFHVGQLQYVADGKAMRLIPSIGDPFSWPAQAARILANGPGAVIFFFALSGFVLTKLLIENSEGSPSVTTSQFIIGRIARIYPGAFCAIAVFYALYIFTGRSIAHPSEYQAWPLLQNAMLLRTSIDGVMWSLQLEIVAAPLLLAVYFAWRRIGFAAIFWPYMLLLGLSFVGWWNHLLGSPGQFGQIYAFLAGMTVYIYGQKYVDRLKYPLACALLVGCSFLAVRHIVGWSSYFTYWFEATFSSALIALLAFGVEAPRKSLLFRALQFLGRISFSFYVLHPLVLAFSADFSPLLSNAVLAGIPPLAMAGVMFVGSVALIAPIAWAQFRLVEVPGVLLGKRLFAMAAPPRRILQST